MRSEVKWARRCGKTIMGLAEDIRTFVPKLYRKAFVDALMSGRKIRALTGRHVGEGSFAEACDRNGFLRKRIRGRIM